MTPPHLTAFFSFILISFLLFTACGDSNALSHRNSQFLMGTLVEIFVIEKDERGLLKLRRKKHFERFADWKK